MRLEEYQALLNELPLGVVIVRGVPPRIVYANPAIAGIVGRTPDEMLALSPEETLGLIHPEDRAEFFRRYEDRLAGDADLSVRYEFRAIARDGSVHWLEAFSTRIDCDGQPATRACFVDISERKRAEHLLQIQRDLGAALSSTNDMTDALDRLLAAVAEMDEVDCGAVYLLDEFSGELKLAAKKNLSGPFARAAARFGASSAPARLVVAATPAYLPVSELPVPDEIRRREGLRGVAIIPVLHEDRAIGSLHVSSRSQDGLSASACAALEAIAARVGSVIARLRSAEALRQSEERYRELIEGTDNVIAQLDGQGRFTFLNRAAGELFGMRLEECIGTPAFDFVHPGDRERTETAFAGWIRDGVRGVTLENRQVSRTGHVRDMLWSINLHYDGAGKVTRLGTIGRDITDRKRIESALRRSEERFRLVTLAARDAVYDWDIDADRSWRNTRYRQLFAPPDDSSSAWWRDRLHPDDRDRVEAELRRALDGPGHRWDTEFRFQKHDGAFGHIQDRAFIVRDATGRPVRMIGAMTDLTDQRQAEERLRASEERYRALFELAADSIVLIDPATGRFVEFNEQAHAALGYTREEFSKLTVADIEATESAAEVARHVKRVLANRPDRFETRHITKEGDVRNVLVSARAISLGGSTFVQSIVRDITDRKRAEDVLRATEALVRQRQSELAHVARLNTMGEMAAGLAHEVNQPLTAIANYAKGCARRIRSRTGSSADLLEPIDQIAVQATRAAQIVQHIRDFIGRREASPSRFDIDALIRETVQLIDHVLRRTHTAIVLELAGNTPPVEGDRIQVQQVVLNLLQNAIEAMAEADSARKRLWIRSAVIARGRVEVAVADAGPGVPGNLANQIFEPFYTTKEEGMGMGLSICRSIISEHGGRLWFTPNPDQGCTFRFTLPAASVRREETAQNEE